MTTASSPRRRQLLTLGLATTPWLARAQTITTTPSVAVGIVRPLSGPLKGVAEGYLEAVRATFADANQQAGASGQRVELVALDDVGDPAQTATQVKALAAQPQVLAVLGIAGTPNVLAAAPVLQEARLPLIGPFSGSDAIRQAQHRGIFHIRASYDHEIEDLVENLAGRYSQGRVLALYQDDAFGAGSFGTFLKAATARAPGMKVSGFKFDRASGDLADAAAATAAARQSDAVFLVAAPRSAARLLGLVRAQSRTATVYTLSVVDALTLVREAGAAAAAGVVITQVMPNPKKSALRLSRDYRALSERHQLPLSYAGLEGHVAARVVLEALRRNKPPMTRDRMTTALEDLGKLDLGGFSVQFGRGQHQGSRFVDLSMIGPSGSVID